jgi:uncharacterized membrane protein
MPAMSVGYYHPLVVHFAVALLFIGVIARAVSLAGRPAFVGPMAATLIVLGTMFAAISVYTGELAHGPVEAMPGVRPEVEAHERWGELTQNLFIVVSIVEVLMLLTARTQFAKYVRPMAALSLVLGLIGLVFLYQAGEHGGRIVYDFAGGVGTRDADPADVRQLALAAVYQQGMSARQNGRGAEAAMHFDQAAAQFPANVDAQLIAAESQMVDRKDPQAALDRLRRITPPSDNAFQRRRHGMLLADALEATGQHDAAIATLQQLQSAFPDNARIKARLEQLQKAR